VLSVGLDCEEVDVSVSRGDCTSTKLAALFLPLDGVFLRLGMVTARVAMLSECRDKIRVVVQWRKYGVEN
jgi:hypothetical protein